MALRALTLMIGQKEVPGAESKHISNEAVPMGSKSYPKRNTAFTCSFSRVS